MPAAALKTPDVCVRRVRLYFQDFSAFKAILCRDWAPFDVPHFSTLPRLFNRVGRHNYAHLLAGLDASQMNATGRGAMRHQVTYGQKASHPKFLDRFAKEKTLSKKGGDFFSYASLPRAGDKKPAAIGGTYHWIFGMINIS